MLWFKRIWDRWFVFGKRKGTDAPEGERRVYEIDSEDESERSRTEPYSPKRKGDTYEGEEHKQ